LVAIGSAAWCRAQEPTVDLSGLRPDSGIAVRRDGSHLVVDWPMEDEAGRLMLELGAGQPLVRSMGIVAKNGNSASPLLENAEPATILLVGSRQPPVGRPPEMSPFNVFFDSPATRPFETHAAVLNKKRVRVTSRGHGATVSIGDVTIGPFAGELRFTVYRGARLVHVETVIGTDLDRRAILYDTGLALVSPSQIRFAWMDTEGKLQSEEPAPDTQDRHLAVRHRALIAQTPHGSVACFPPPHQFFSPRDLTENLRTVWFGRNHRGRDDRFGFGVRQSERGGGSFVPWFNAPPGTEQHLGVFYLLSSGNAERALEQTLRYTHGDRFPKLAGYHTLTSHWHMAIATAALENKAKGAARGSPDFVSMFKNMGVEVVHLAEFHGDGHPRDPGPLRLPEMQAMFEECARLSDSEFLVLPGEEANTYLGRAQPGRETGHWMYLFPKPVYWTMTRSSGQPFVEDHPQYGPVYHIGSGADMAALLEREGGLAWTSHPRIKASSWTPDIFRREDFYRSDTWLGAAWKAMPADLSDDELGRRALHVLDDMANWGQKKYLLGEVDVFKLDHSHELYGHMNVNYVRLEPDRVPRFVEGWKPVVDALRSGRFFVTTGEVAIAEFSVRLGPRGGGAGVTPGEKAEVRALLSWTFPLKYVELISGDGMHVFRERIDCSDTGPFDQRTVRLAPDLTGRAWARLEAWDIAGNGAFTQPVWLESSSN
jgi:hypothetical protein